MAKLKHVFMVVALSFLAFFLFVKFVKAPMPSPLQLFGLQSFFGLGTDGEGFSFTKDQWMDWMATRSILISVISAGILLIYWKIRRSSKTLVSFLKENKEGIIYAISGVVLLQIWLIWPLNSLSGTWGKALFTPYLLASTSIGALLGAIIDDNIKEGKWI